MGVALGRRARQAVASVTALVAGLVAGSGSLTLARADDGNRAECIQAYVDAQADRKDGALVRAAHALSVCARDVCPGMIVRDCSQWVEEVHRATPSLVLVARDEEEHDLTNVNAFVDGTKAPLDGKPLALDPGRHLVRFQQVGADSQEQVVTLVEGEHSRAVTAVFTRRHAAASSRPVPAGTWALGAVSVASSGVFAYFAGTGASDRASLGCDRACSEGSYSHVNGEFVAADVALGVGLASLGAAVAWFLLRPTVRADAHPAAAPTRFGSF